jgi:hypothetical protein
MSESDWKKTFSDVQEYALSPTMINDLYPPHNVLLLQRRLSQLIEACHLIEIRNNTNKTHNRKKNNY